MKPAVISHLAHFLGRILFVSVAQRGFRESLSRDVELALLTSVGGKAGLVRAPW